MSLLSNQYFSAFYLFMAVAVSGLAAASEPANSSFLPIVSDLFENQLQPAAARFPRNFRTTQGSIPVEGLDIRLDGLADLQIAGTGQFNRTQLEEILTLLKSKTWVVDLREETHLHLEDREGMQLPISAFLSLNRGNAGKTPAEIEYELQTYKHHIEALPLLTVHHTVRSFVQIDSAAPVFEPTQVYTERELIEKLHRTSPYGVGYFFLPIRDHRIPDPHFVDSYLRFIQNIKDENSTLLFHCRAGRGRTGTFMIMQDMIKNAKKYDLSFDDILKRQHLLGSPDFSKVNPDREEFSNERYQFLQNFYEFVLAEDGLESGHSYSIWQALKAEKESNFKLDS